MLFTSIKTDSFSILRLKFKKNPLIKKTPQKYIKNILQFLLYCMLFMKIWKKICVNLFALLVRKLINCRYLKDILKKNENKRTFWQRQFAPVQTKPSIWMQSRTLVTAPISNYKKIVVHYIKQTSRSDILISFLVHCLGTFFFHCLPSFTHNYEGRHEEASLPIASSRCRSNLSDWRSESEEI